MSNSTSSNKKSAWQLLEERQVEMVAKIAWLEVDTRREAEEKECKHQEAEEERKRMEEQKQKDIEETRKRLAEWERKRLMKARADNASELSGLADPEVASLASHPYPNLTLVILVILAFPFALYLSLQQSQYIWPDPFADKAYPCSIPPPD
ncbi:uncharacterized protein EDB93DRAFT_1245275 [Suillus bovinus]|uniref:uncharacterized protein n=1 Tax=Suillus bovinus TaxID=48563 RepID=UPI001B85BA65|nr:uncharacterized protein EDB93DRAFT_1245275 [Suillus bovinus]KAG2159482.1 hypothetical protein EDB93DRAFT_1245275 [Suillus bovinus]